MTDRKAKPLVTDDPKKFYEIIKEQLALFSLLIVFAGISVTEAYYWQFGLRSQMLSLPIHHLLYRGLTALVQAPYVAIPYLGCMAWLAAIGSDPTKSRSSMLLRKPVAGYIVCAILMLATYLLGLVAGSRAARADMVERTTTLPLVVSISPGSLAVPGDGYRMLGLQGDFVAVFKPLGQWRTNERPILKLLRSSGIEEIELAH